MGSLSQVARVQGCLKGTETPSAVKRSNWREGELLDSRLA